MARTARRQLEGRHLLLGEYLRSSTTLNVHYRRLDKLKARSTHTNPRPGQYLMRTAISPRQWQPWTAVSPLLGLISMHSCRINERGKSTAWVIWLCACVRYWPGRGLVYMWHLLKVCLTIEDELNIDGGKHVLAMFSK